MTTKTNWSSLLTVTITIRIINKDFECKSFLNYFKNRLTNYVKCIKIRPISIDLNIGQVINSKATRKTL